MARIGTLQDFKLIDDEEIVRMCHCIIEFEQRMHIGRGFNYYMPNGIVIDTRIINTVEKSVKSKLRESQNASNTVKEYSKKSQQKFVNR